VYRLKTEGRRATIIIHDTTTCQGIQTIWLCMVAHVFPFGLSPSAFMAE